MEENIIYDVSSEPSDVSKHSDITTINEMNSEVCDNSQIQLNDPLDSNLIFNINQRSESTEKKGPVFVDHCYARPWNWRPGSTFLKPTKTLFMPKPVKNVRKRSFNPLAPLQNFTEKIDVEEVPTELPPIYDVSKARNLMEECEKHASTLKTNQSDDWEESVVPLKLNWSAIQHKLFNGMVNILNMDRLGRLSFEGSLNEPIMRRTVIEKSVKRVRKLLATVWWDAKLTQWLHQLLLDHLNTSYLSIYLDILQTLKSKLPTFVDKIIYSVGMSSRTGAVSNENLFMLLKRPWDPVASSLMQDKPKKLPGNPVIVIAPSAPSIAGDTMSKRYQKWINLLSNLTSVIPVTVNIGNMGHRMTMMNCADQMFAAMRTRVQEIRNDLPGRPVILVGFNLGAALALQVAQVENVSCVICVGFSLQTVDGKRGEPDDNLLELQCPVLFVIGQCASKSSQEELEDLRERMRIETGLIIVGSADDYLRINKKKKQAEGITQDVVDRCIVDEIGEFVGSIMLSPVPPQLRHSPVNIPADGQPPVSKRMKMERKRNNSNDSSIDSEPPSPTTRIVRPVGRPPGSKSKNKLESRWAAQLSQGTNPPPVNLSPPTSPRPHPTITPTPTTTLSDSSVSETSVDNNLTPEITSSVNKALPPNNNNTVQLQTNNTTIATTQQKTTPVQASKLQSIGFGRSIIGPGMTKNELKNITTSKFGAGIKVLDNVTISPGSHPVRYLSNTSAGKMNRNTYIKDANNPPGSFGNVMLTADGKIKTTGTTPIILPVSGGRGKSQQPAPPTRYTKYITSKKQLSAGRKPTSAIQQSSALSIPFNTSNLPPPTNLTSQDIMDLPIIFADDDNQILTESNTILQSNSEIIPQKPTLMSPTSVASSSITTGISTPTSIIITNSSLKRPALSVPVRASTHPVKYTKIILSRASDGTSGGGKGITTKLTGLPPDISVKKVEVPIKSSDNFLEPIDLEKELVATTISKPNYALVTKKIVEKEKIDQDVKVNKDQQL